jgi:DtxR family Mn-dependent transcriptional regulator
MNFVGAERREMTESLQDYLETIYHLTESRKVARVKDIAKDRNVRAASVSTAMRRLQELGLINYSQREYIELTERGQEAVRPIIARHEILRRFFEGFLQVDPKIADEDACQIEHHLSNETTDRLVRVLEFLETCPEGKAIQDAFQKCPVVNPARGDCDAACAAHGGARHEAMRPVCLGELAIGERGRIVQLNAAGPLRRRLIDMGLLPLTEVSVERAAPSGDPIWIKVRNFDLSLRRDEAQGILVTPLP